MGKARPPIRKPNPSAKKRMMDALEKTMGIVTPACEMAGINRTTHYEWLKIDESYRKCIQDTLEKKRDFVEISLVTLIKNGDTGATIFAAKTLLRNRGYAQSEDNGGVSVEHEAVFILLSGGRQISI